MVSFAKEQGECFYDVFGALGIPMVVAFIFSAGAMFNQAYIQVYPSEYANMLMNTTNYDDGEFWLLDKTNPATVAAATTLLVFFGCLYLVLVVYMLFFRHLAIEKEPPAVRNSKSIESSSYLSTGRESTNTEVESEITVTEIAKGVFITNLGFVRDAVTGLLPCLKSRLQRPQLHPLDIAQRKSAALAKRKMKRARAIYFQFSDIDGVYHAYYVRGFTVCFAFGLIEMRLTCPNGGVYAERHVRYPEACVPDGDTCHLSPKRIPGYHGGFLLRDAFVQLAHLVLSVPAENVRQCAIRGEDLLPVSGLCCKNDIPHAPYS